MRPIFNKLKECVDLKNKVVINTNLNRDNLEFLIGEKPKKIYFLYNYLRDLSFPKSQKVELIPIDSSGKNKILENVDVVLADCFWTSPDNFKSLKILGSMLLKNQIKKINKLIVLGWKCNNKIACDSDISYNFEQKAVAQEMLENYLKFLFKFNNFKPEAKEIITKLPSEFRHEYFQIFEKKANFLN